MKIKTVTIVSKISEIKDKELLEELLMNTRINKYYYTSSEPKELIIE